MSVVRKHHICSLFLLGLISSSLPPADAAVVVPGGYAASVYAGGLPANSEIAGMGVDLATRTFYYSETDSGTTARLFRVAADRTLTNLGQFTSAAGGYPFVASDVQYANGFVYGGGFAGVGRISAAGGAATVIAAGNTNEAGLAAADGKLYITGGLTTPGVLKSYDLTTGSLTTIPITGLPNYASSLEVNPVTGQLYVAGYSDQRFYAINLLTNTATLVPGTLPAVGSTYGNFAIDPDGQFIYTRQGNVITRLAIATGLTSTFATGLTSTSGFADMVFAPASSGPGGSMYIADANAIIEVTGFASIPEPSTLAVSVAGVALLKRRRR